MIDVIKHNMVSVGSMTLGLILGQTEPHGTFSDPTSVGLIKDYVSMTVAIGGFLLLVYNTFIKKSK